MRIGCEETVRTHDAGRGAETMAAYLVRAVMAKTVATPSVTSARRSGEEAWKDKGEE
jgi:hypothetical protein